MTLPIEAIPDLPDAPESPPAKPRRARKPAPVVDADTGEIIVSPLEEIARATEIVAMQGALVSQVASETRGYNVAEATPEARAALVDFYNVLRKTADDLDVRAKSIELAWQIAMRELGAQKLPLPDGRLVELIPPATQYQVDGQELANQLKAFVEAGLVSATDANEAVQVTVSLKFDHRVINKLARNAPAEVREAIAAYRREVPPISGGRVKLPKPLK